jgi:hypothetical protein
MPISIPTSIAGISVPGLINGPLRLLYGNKYVREGLKYPRNLGDDATRNHIIQFVSYQPNPSYVPNLAGTTADLVRAGASSILPNAETIPANELKEKFKAFGSEIAKADVPRIPDKTISLYIPDTVNVAYNYGYDETLSLTESLGKAYFLAQAGTSLYDIFKQGGDKNGIQLANQIANDPFVATTVANAVGNRLGASNLGDLVARGMGQALNPQLQVLFRGVGFRSFQFDFVFTPHNKQETEEVKKIIEAFKFASAPEIVPSAYFSEGSLFFKVPYPFEIKFFYKGKENPYVHRLERCVLENINVDYGPNGWSTFNDGSPVQIKMTLQFKETSIIDKNKVKAGY